MSTDNTLPATIAKTIIEQQSRVWRLRSLLESLVYGVSIDGHLDMEAALMGIIEMADSIHGALDAGALADRAAELREDGAQREAFTSVVGSNNGMANAVKAQLNRLFEAQAIVELSDIRLNAFSGDEDSLEIVENLSSVSSALRGANRLIADIHEALEIASNGRPS